MRKYSDKELVAFVLRITEPKQADIARKFIEGLHGVPKHEKEALYRTIETIEYINGWGVYA